MRGYASLRHALDNAFAVLYNISVDELEKKVADKLRAHAGERIAIGVSGGRDSSCLLRAVVACCVVPLGNITVVHVNHGLRNEADGDEAFVVRMCKELDVECRTFRIDAAGEARAKGLTVEQAARDLRYGIFYGLIRSREADRIMTAHHALDNAETVLMHLFRGAGLGGVRAMDDRQVLRPFIDIYPEELDGYASRNGIEYVDDATNFIDDADRNFIRLNVLPVIERRYRGAIRAVNAFSRECATAYDVLDGAVDPSLITSDRGAAVISDAALETPVAAYYVRRALERFSLTDVTREQVENVVRLRGMRTGAVAELANGVKAAREYGRVALYVPRPEYRGEKPLVIGNNYIDGLTVRVERGTGDARALVADYGKLGGATIRFRRDGDTFVPFGGGRKKLKQYFIDKKIPRRVRDRIPLVCRGSEVLVAVGVEISDTVKLTDDTTERVVIYKRQ